ncbi:MAG: hypothetical protein V1798_07115 [Pseudomonadota bacterium]
MLKKVLFILFLSWFICGTALAQAISTQTPLLTKAWAVNGDQMECKIFPNQVLLTTTFNAASIEKPMPVTVTQKRDVLVPVQLVHNLIRTADTSGERDSSQSFADLLANASEPDGKYVAWLSSTHRVTLKYRGFVTQEVFRAHRKTGRAAEALVKIMDAFCS